MNTKPKTKVLTISLLCCGRPDTTERCLQSLMPIREAVDSEIIVVDTGCDAETRAIVDKYADEVIEFEWCNDFAKARNVQLDAANGEWFMFLDDDEVFVDVADIVRFFNSDECKKYTYGGYKKRDYFNFEGTDWVDNRPIRMVKVTPEVSIKGKIHEYISGFEGDGIHFSSLVDHYGYCFETEESKKAHSKRNQSLLIEMMETEPDNWRWPAHMAQELYPCSDGSENTLYELCDSTLKTMKYTSKDKRYYNTMIIGRMLACNELGHNQELKDFYKDMQEDTEVFELTKAYASLVMANTFFIQLDFENCLITSLKYIESYKRLANDSFQMYMQRAMLLVNVFRDDNLYMALSVTFACAIKLKRYEYIDKYIDLMKWDAEQLKISRGFLQILLEALLNEKEEKSTQTIVTRVLTNKGLKSALKYEIHENAVEMPKSCLENLKVHFAEWDDMLRFVDIQIGRMENPSAYDEMYEIEGRMLEQIEVLNALGESGKASEVKDELQNMMSRILGVKSLR